jgi:MSHA pilin protein MshD
MCMTRTHQRGFTLIELIIFIVVISVGIAGILSVMNTVVKSSADPMVRKQAAVAAESILEEIMLKSYTDPDPLVSTGETTRATIDDVDDFKGKTGAQLATLFTDLLAQVPGYTIAITVDNEALFSGVNAKKITVTVSRGGESVSLSSYRTSY